MQPFGIAADSLEPISLTIVTMTFDASDQARLAAVLSNYVVTSRGDPGCRNIDLCVAVGRETRFVIIEKWESAEHQRAHFDGAAMVEMATACNGLLAAAPSIELLDGISAHDIV